MIGARMQKSLIFWNHALLARTIAAKKRLYPARLTRTSAQASWQNYVLDDETVALHHHLNA